MKRIFKGPLIWIIVAVVGVLIAMQFLISSGGGDEISSSQMSEYVSKGEVKDITFVDGDQVIKATLDDSVDRDGGREVTTKYLSGTQAGLFKAAQEQFDKGEIDKITVEVSRPGLLSSLLFSFLPILILVVLFFWLMNSMQGGGGRGVMQFAKSKAKLISKDMPKTTFADVAGCDEAIEELGEIKEFLQEPAKFQAVGAKIPKGVLLYGAPGTGKTLLARA
ncbi:MAG TPA: cell division protein FtsH, partial [Nocardioides bacterium]|nr:cell division protein FtsH [Nocardioides sp.]